MWNVWAEVGLWVVHVCHCIGGDSAVGNMTEQYFLDILKEACGVAEYNSGKLHK